MMFQLTSKRVILSRTGEDAFETAWLARPTSSAFCSDSNIGSSPTIANRAVFLSKAAPIASKSQSVALSKELLGAFWYRKSVISGSE